MCAGILTHCKPETEIGKMWMRRGWPSQSSWPGAQEAFGPSTFYVTEMLLGGQAELTNGALRMPGGILVRGNLRTSREEAFDTAEAAIKRMFGAFHMQRSITRAHGSPPHQADRHTHACAKTTALPATRPLALVPIQSLCACVCAAECRRHLPDSEWNANVQIITRVALQAASTSC